MHPAEHRVGHYNQRDSLFQHVDGPQHIKIAEKIADGGATCSNHQQEVASNDAAQALLHFDISWF
jgi:hypothetical protein